MKRPDDPFVVLLDVVKEHRKIYIAVVKVVNMDEIRIELFYLAKEIPCGNLRITAVVAVSLVKLLMDIVRDLIADVDTVLVLVLIAARIKSADHFVTFL